ncbi:hypothetical protein I7I50_08574 [Histoplasma capsulatum G186AR]|uniref:Uncharacterized protein n=1 Tax=Ajellomyces capsulatus TaxID=5037 RepID=A0A8H8CZB9_AJECA|nr:hypothetical protein I7I52_06089 [Histoplasma capsulatum]QSS73696.1 hypothetical protein I7I50_08574 [Histoplasma capsulatum G186AR]
MTVSWAVVEKCMIEDGQGYRQNKIGKRRWTAAISTGNTCPPTGRHSPSPSLPTPRFSSASAKLRLLAPLPFPFPSHICAWTSQRDGRLDWRIYEVVLCFTMGYFAILPFFIIVIISPSRSFSSLPHCFLWSSMDPFFSFCRLGCWFVFLFVFPSALVVLAVHPQLIAILPP